MTALLDPLLIVILAINFFALGVSRIRGVINAVAIQGHRPDPRHQLQDPRRGSGGHASDRQEGRQCHRRFGRRPEIPGQIARIDLIEKPEPLLRKRQRGLFLTYLHLCYYRS